MTIDEMIKTLNACIERLNIVEVRAGLPNAMILTQLYHDMHSVGNALLEMKKGEADEVCED